MGEAMVQPALTFHYKWQIDEAPHNNGAICEQFHDPFLSLSLSLSLDGQEMKVLVEAKDRK